LADIFISYSKVDRSLVAKLAAFLQGRGYSVWWDTELVSGDAFRDEIMKQLALARVALVVWTKDSINSDWVRAEAGRAKADGKLIPLKTSDVQYADIPLPFGEMHTEDLAAFDLVRLAVVNQLARPVERPGIMAVATGRVRFQLLSWLGVIGGALTILNQMQGFVRFAEWLQWLLANWYWATHAFWAQLAAAIGVPMPAALSPILTFSAFVGSLIIGARLRPLRYEPLGKPTWKRRLLLIGFKLALTVGHLLLLAYLYPRWIAQDSVWTILILLAGLIAIALIGERHKIHIILSSVILISLWGIVLLVPVLRRLTSINESIAASIFMIVALALLPLLPMIAPIKSVTRRLLQLVVLISVVLGVARLAEWWSAAPRPSNLPNQSASPAGPQ
jgi:hypothetical protein